MERLTFEHEGKKCFYCGDEDGNDCECKVCSVDCAVCNPCPVEQMVIDRLAAYEDTGFAPDDIKTMHGELCLKCGQYQRAHLGACNGCRWKKEVTQDGRTHHP